MTRAWTTRLIKACSLILFFWGVIYSIFWISFRHSFLPEESGLIQLEGLSKGLLIIFTGLALSQLPPLLRRGEYQASRILTFAFFFLAVLTFLHIFRSPLQEPIFIAAPAVLGFCSLLLLIALIWLHRSLHLPRL